jgi:hypothetical protein
MADYFQFMNAHQNLLFRGFFGLATAVDLLFLYAALFNRNLPPRLAQWFFGALSGQRITIPPPSTDKPPWWSWLAFAFVSAVPPVAWLLFEIYITKSISWK